MPAIRYGDKLLGEPGSSMWAVKVEEKLKLVGIQLAWSVVGPDRFGSLRRTVSAATNKRFVELR